MAGHFVVCNRLLLPALRLMLAFALVLLAPEAATGQGTVHDDASPKNSGFTMVEPSPGPFSFDLQRTVFSEAPKEVKEKIPALEPITVEQLESFLKAAHAMRDADVARQLARYQLTERFSSVKLATWLAVLRD